MPRKTSKTSPITIYPSHELAEKLTAIAAAERRSISSQVLIWIEQRPELNGEVVRGKD